MSRLPRWYRERCPHDNRIVLHVASGRIVRDYCRDCGAEWPTMSPQVEAAVTSAALGVSVGDRAYLDRVKRSLDSLERRKP